MKKCSKCGVEKLVNEFYKSKNCKDGFNSWCKNCHKKGCGEYQKKNKNKVNKKNREWVKKNKEKVRKYKKNWRKKNKEKINKNFKEYYLKNKEKVKESSEKWKKKNKDKVKEYRIKNKDKMREYYKNWRENNKEKVNKQKKEYRKNNIEKIREWQKNNRDRINKRSRIWQKQRSEIDVKYRIDNSISGHIWYALKGKKAGRSWESLAGYTLEDLVKHLESKFESWMSWENYGQITKDKKTWNIDHIKPKSLFRYKTAEEEEFKKCWALENLQPLCAVENRKKGNKYKENLIKNI